MEFLVLLGILFLFYSLNNETREDRKNWERIHELMSDVNFQRQEFINFLGIFSEHYYDKATQEKLDNITMELVALSSLRSYITDAIDESENLSSDGVKEIFQEKDQEKVDQLNYEKEKILLENFTPYNNHDIQLMSRGNEYLNAAIKAMRVMKGYRLEKKYKVLLAEIDKFLDLVKTKMPQFEVYSPELNQFR